MVDERQDYLYRVQTRSIEAGDALTDALMQQAQWQYAAYQLGLGPDGYIRLLNMSELYGQALRNVVADRGKRGRNIRQTVTAPTGHAKDTIPYCGLHGQESDRAFERRRAPA